MICLWALDKQLECQYFIHGSSIDPFKVENFQLENDLEYTIHLQRRLLF